ncbi:hypothetical protein HBI55_052580, partial [Parastagonospora nodorum]
VSVPAVSVPAISLPSLPTLSVPAISLPAVSVPAVSVPAISLPSLPTLSVPAISLPAVSVPAISLPSLPTLSVPAISVPAISVPSLPAVPSLPVISIPGIGLPNPRPTTLATVVSSAAPTTTTPTGLTTTILPRAADFENNVGFPLLALSPINTYLDIFWQGFTLAQTPAAQGILTVVPYSGTNVASFSSLNMLQGGAAMSVTYAGSVVNTFDLTSFFYGCALPIPLGFVAVPTTCKITIKGYTDDAATISVGEQTFSFTTKVGQTSAQMSKALVDAKFKGLKRVTFTTDTPLAAGVIDSVSYSINKWTGF